MLAYCCLVVNAKADRHDPSSGLGVRGGLCIVPGHTVGSVLECAASSVLERAANSSVQFCIEYGHKAEKGKEMGSDNRVRTT